MCQKANFPNYVNLISIGKMYQYLHSSVILCRVEKYGLHISSKDPNIKHINKKYLTKSLFLIPY